MIKSRKAISYPLDRWAVGEIDVKKSKRMRLLIMMIKGFEGLNLIRERKWVGRWWEVSMSLLTLSLSISIYLYVYIPPVSRQLLTPPRTNPPYNPPLVSSRYSPTIFFFFFFIVFIWVLVVVWLSVCTTHGAGQVEPWFQTHSRPGGLVS